MLFFYTIPIFNFLREITLIIQVANFKYSRVTLINDQQNQYDKLTFRWHISYQNDFDIQPVACINKSYNILTDTSVETDVEDVCNY